MSDYAFSIDLKVRDYECDLQGIVNNSVYQNYLEHCRHEFLLNKGQNFAELAEQGINLVVTRVELDYLGPLKSGDECKITVSCQKLSKIRYTFTQSIIRKSDDKVVLNGLVYWTAINERGRPMYCEQLNALFEN